MHFFRTLAAARHLDGFDKDRQRQKVAFLTFLRKYVVFGKVVDGMDLVEKLSKLPVDEFDRPVDDVQIVHSGELVLEVIGRCLYLYALGDIELKSTKPLEMRAITPAASVGQRSVIARTERNRPRCQRRKQWPVTSMN